MTDVSPNTHITRKKGCILLVHPTAAGSALYRTITRFAESIGVEVYLCNDLSVLEDIFLKIHTGISLAIFSPHLLDVVEASRIFYSRTPSAEIVFVCSTSQEKSLRIQLGPMPRIGTHWQVFDPENADFRRVLEVAYRGGEQRRSVRTTLDRFNARLMSTPVAVDPLQLRKLVISERFLASVLEHSADAVLSLDSENRIVGFNPAAERLFGFEQADAVSRSITNIVGGAWHDDIVRLLKEGETKSPVNLAVPLPSGTRQVDVSVHPIHEPSGNRIAFTLMLRDVTERLQAEDALRKAEALAATGRLAATLSHEINNPLEAITNLLYLMSSENLSENAREYVKLANLELERVSHIVKQTLVFYRDRGSDRNHRFDPKEAIDHIVRIYSGRIMTRAVRLTTNHATEGELRMAKGDFQQVVSNLVSNAIDACGRDGAIQISSRFDNDRYRLCVEDSGGGVPEELLEKIFTPFFTTKEDVGTGLGLWVTKDIVEKYEGTISVRNSAKGAVFTVEVPVDSAAA